MKIIIELLLDLFILGLMFQRGSDLIIISYSVFAIEFEIKNFQNH